jgi:hypothetical protein
MSSFVTMVSRFPLLIFKAFNLLQLGRDWCPVAGIWGQQDIKDEGSPDNFKNVGVYFV